MSPDKQPLSVAEVFELQPGDEQNPTWINPGMIGVVRSIERKVGKSNKPRWVVVWGDETGSATIESAFFKAPTFADGDLVEMEGSLRRTEFSGTAQVNIGMKTSVRIVGKSAHHAEQQQRAATGAPAVDGTPQMVGGHSVGMAMKEALALTVMAWGGIEGLAKLKDQLFWADVKTNASNIIRLSRSLEHGKLSPSPWQTAATEPPKATTTPPPQNPPRRSAPANEREAANLSDDDMTDIPF